ncbi:Adaptin N terminal region family protein [Tritrichomonas foetus]|uniref:Coatomer subunit beta n=1 Tax=Tritrichomonas foetus TaxID=1144522 RepID=A0A1J4KHX0_9EUKA|nr:Adaptin N terminal region family protein [Tritrichomonas foetus]|eukprot:OHT10642.1 Adaptin N terminal region family protein [Tritrichomonas foetus]
MNDESAPFLCPPKDQSSAKWDEIEESLSNMNDQQGQIRALKQLIQYQASGESPPESVLMKTIQYTATSKNHIIKKHLFLYYEIVDTRDRKGNLKSEFLLICDALRNDLIHPNQYLRAAALRLVSKFQEPELISPLVSTISESLTHHSSYVRRHAVVAIGRINQRWPNLAPDAPEEIADLLRVEKDPSCRRVAFLVLCDISRDLAAEFLDEAVDENLLNLSQSMQLTATALIRSLCNDKRRNSYLPALYDLLGSPSAGVQLASALTLLDLTSTTTASRDGLTTLCKIMLSVPNSSLQLSIADQIERLIPTHTSVAQELAVELLNALKAKPIRAKILGIVQKLTTTDNAANIAQALIRYAQSANSLRQNENEKNDSILFIRQILSTLRIIIASHPIALKYVYEGVNSFIADSDSQISYDAMEIIRDIAKSAPELRKVISVHLENLLGSVRTSRVLRMALFIISLYTNNPDSVDVICEAFAEDETQANAADITTVVLEDGTYVQRTSAEVVDDSPSLYSILCKEPFLVSSVSVSLARICCRLSGANAQRAIDFIKSAIVKANVETELNRIGFALMALEHPNDEHVKDILLNASEETFNQFISNQMQSICVKPTESSSQVSAVDQMINFSSLLGKRFTPPSRSIQRVEKKKGELIQLTGSSDTIFCECRLIANKFDISLDFRLLNQTNTLFTNVKVELNCVGKLELIDRPSPLRLPPDTSENVRFTVKVTSAEDSRIFGTISYDVTSMQGTDQRILPLAVITVSSADYMVPAYIDPTSFRKKWEEFEWERKIQIHCSFPTLTDFVNKICQISKLKLISDPDPDLPFLTANLYSRSFFGEEVLANVNVEMNEGTISGFFRLRTDSQSMALSFSRLIENIE